MALRIVAAYDVSDDARRARLAARLQHWGDRVQKSVFVLILETDQFVALVKQAEGIIDLDSDSLWFWRQCEPCDSRAVVLGQTKPINRPKFWIVM